MWRVAPSLEEQIFRSSVIVRASLRSATGAVETVPSDPGVAPTFRPVQELRFTAHEYLKGTGPTALLVVVRGAHAFLTEAEAREQAEIFVALRVTAWDDRQGVLFLGTPAQPYGSAAASGGASGAAESSSASALQFTQSNWDQSPWDYSVDTLSRAWLPARDPGGATGQAGDAAGMAFITDGSSSPPPAVTLTDLRTQIGALAAELRAGEGITGYRECILERIGRERHRRAVPWTAPQLEVTLASGLASGSEVNRGTNSHREPQYHRWWLSGPDHERFQARIIDDDDQSNTGYDHALVIARPLAAGTYHVRYNWQTYSKFPCNFMPDDAYDSFTVTVSAPEGTVQEAFFDPVALGAGAGSDGANGALTPSAFTVGGTAATLQRLTWEANQLQLELSAAVPLADHYLDVIALDGTVALRLRLDDAASAATDSGGQAWRWRACTAPWATGDQLMLRLHHSATALPDVSAAPGCGPAPTFTGAPYAFTLAENAAAGAAVGTVTATAAGSTAVTYEITQGNPGEAFAIDGSSGVLTVAGMLDYETTASYTLTVAASEAASAVATATVTIAVTDVTVDYDADDDGLLEVATLAQLHAIRWDLDGNGTATNPGYAVAFHDAVTGMGCPPAGCTGYELLADLDVDTDGSGTVDASDGYWNDGAGWEPLGHAVTAFTATFDGNGHVIANLLINRGTMDNVGLFGQLGSGSEVRHVGLRAANVTGQYQVGGLVGYNHGTIRASYVTGRVAGQSGGGLAGFNQGRIVASYAAAAVTTAGDGGGLVGFSGSGAWITASYATGAVTGNARAGGLTAGSVGRIAASYATGAVSGAGTVGGLMSVNVGAVTASYWDTATSGQGTSAGGAGATTSALQTPTGYTGIYADWNVDIDGAAGGDDPWDFGTASEYPVLQVDFDGDGTASWQEFGDQRPASN